MEESVIDGESLTYVEAYFGKSERCSAVFVAQSLYVTLRTSGECREEQS
jgi:hypothetical protein